MVKKFVAFACIMLGLALQARATLPPKELRALYDKVKPSLVVVQYTFNNELGRRDLAGQGVVVEEKGVVVASMMLFPVQIPNKQMIDFKIIVPSQGDRPEKEYEATFLGRDERTNLAFLQTKEPQKWQAVTFEDHPMEIGDTVVSMGLLPKDAGYHPFITQPTLSAILRGPIPQVLVSADGLTTFGSPVFSTDGKAIGMVNAAPDASILLNAPEGNPMGAAAAPPRVYVPAHDFIQSFTDLPVAGQPEKLPWLGVAQLTGVNKDLSDYLGLKNQTAVQIGAIVPGTAADKAGLKAGDVVVKVNGKALERGDEPEEAAQILLRKVRRMKVGDKLTFTLRSGEDKDKAPYEVSMILEQRPQQANEVARYYAKDLGFAVRDMVFEDKYARKLPDSAKGVIVALVKPSGSAESGHLRTQDMITQINGKPVNDVADFTKLYKAARADKPKDPVILEVLHGGTETEVIRIEPPQ